MARKDAVDRPPSPLNSSRLANVALAPVGGSPMKLSLNKKKKRRMKPGVSKMMLGDDDENSHKKQRLPALYSEGGVGRRRRQCGFGNCGLQSGGGRAPILVRGLMMARERPRFWAERLPIGQAMVMASIVEGDDGDDQGSADQETSAPCPGPGGVRGIQHTTPNTGRIR